MDHEFKTSICPKYTAENIDKYINQTNNEYVRNRLKSIKVAILKEIERNKPKEHESRKAKNS